VIYGYPETEKPLYGPPAASQENGVKIAPARIGQSMRKPGQIWPGCFIVSLDCRSFLLPGS